MLVGRFGAGQETLKMGLEAQPFRGNERHGLTTPSCVYSRQQHYLRRPAPPIQELRPYEAARYLIREFPEQYIGRKLLLVAAMRPCKTVH